MTSEIEKYACTIIIIEYGRRSSEKRPQAAADLEDILLAFSKLDEVDKIPQIYCEATELVKLPPIAADPISELVMGNSLCLKD